MFAFLTRNRTRSKQAAADAAALIAQFGASAYGEARRRAREASQDEVIDGNRPLGHWDRVRRVIGRKIGRDGFDTATRYLTRR
jgi:hypothetical protein